MATNKDTTSDQTDNTKFSSQSTDTAFTPVSYDVALIPQPNKFACWAASMAMILSYKRQASITPETLANEVGRDLSSSYSWDLLESVCSHYGFTSLINVPSETSVYYTPQQWDDWLTQYGPIWFTFIWSDGESHALVLKGISGDGTPEGTYFDIQNPWDINTTFDNNDPVNFNPENVGTTQNMPFLEFANTFGSLGYDSAKANFRIMYLQ